MKDDTLNGSNSLTSGTNNGFNFCPQFFKKSPPPKKKLQGLRSGKFNYHDQPDWNNLLMWLNIIYRPNEQNMLSMVFIYEASAIWFTESSEHMGQKFFQEYSAYYEHVGHSLKSIFGPWVILQYFLQQFQCGWSCQHNPCNYFLRWF
jgi:hypothetical protein